MPRKKEDFKESKVKSTSISQASRVVLRGEKHSSTKFVTLRSSMQSVTFFEVNDNDNERRAAIPDCVMTNFDDQKMGRILFSVLTIQLTMIQ